MSISSYQSILDNILTKKATDYRIPEMKDLLTDVQANILKSHNKNFAAHTFISFYEENDKQIKDDIKAWLKKLKITSALEQLENRYNEKNNLNPVISIYFSHEGYEYLDYELKQIPESGAMPFSQSPQGRLSLHKNLEENKLPFLNKIHVMLLIAGDEKKDVEKTLDEYLKAINIKKFTNNERERNVLRRFGHAFVQWGEKKEVGPFGFTDKTSNPLFFPDPKKTENPNDINYISDEEITELSTILIKDPNGRNWNSCGSFLAFLKLRQDEKAFQAAAETIKTSTEVSLDVAKALVMGKLPNDSVKGDVYINHNKGCPLHKSHIQAAKKSTESRYLPITRRGINYKDSKDNQGLLFMSFQANIKHQFEALINLFFTNRKGGKVDPLLYNHQLVPSIPFHFPTSNKGNSSIKFETPFVTLQKGWYFFAPSISSIKRL